MKKHRHKNSSSSRLLIFVVLFAALGYFVVRAVANSLFIRPIDRLNIVIYGSSPLVYSLDRTHDVDYLISFVPDLKIQVPGGYSEYRFGALGKLVELTHDPDLLKRSFSNATSAFVPFYFYPSNNEVSYGVSGLSNSVSPTLRQVFFYHSNASLLDKVYIYLELLKREKNEYTLINQFPTQKTGGGTDFSEAEFSKKYLGFFFQRSYRNEKKTVQILYTSYDTALAVGRIIEGNGIRVVDLSEGKSAKTCEVVESGGGFSKSARSIAQFLGCSLKNGDTAISDIIVILGDEVEKKWEIK